MIASTIRPKSTFAATRIPTRSKAFYSIFQRGMKGVYQHCSEKYLHRYLSEFDFRYSYRDRLGHDDATRTEIAIKGAEGKRLTYRRTRSQEAA
jgi:hypothetical protein